MQIVGIDFMHLDTCSGGYQYILVITDHFSRYTQAYPTRNKVAKTAAEKLYMTKVVSLKTDFSSSWTVYVESTGYEPRLTIRKQMVKLNAWT